MSFMTQTIAGNNLLTHINKQSTIGLTAVECSNTVLNNYGQTAVNTLTLPTATLGLSFQLVVSTTGYALHIKAGASDKIYLDGTALDDGDKVSVITPSISDSVYFFCFQTGASTCDWFCSSINGYWVDGGV